VLLGIAANCTTTAIALVILHDMLLTAVAAGITLAGLVAFAAQLVIITEKGAVLPLDVVSPNLTDELHAQLGVRNERSVQVG
jgi:hypothetical protein